MGEAGTTILLVAWAVINGVWSVLIVAQFQLRRRGLLLAPRAWRETNPNNIRNAIRAPDASPGTTPYEMRAWREHVMGEKANPNDPPNRTHAPDSASTVCIVIPAHNEQAVLAACLRSALAQDYPALTIVIADDRSTDATESIARRFAEEHAHVRVERIAELPEGWLGKSHALWRATRSIEADWLLFLDADCTLSPCAVSTAVHEARRRGAGLLSLWPRHDGQSFWEHLLIPLCGGIIALWYGSHRVNDPASALAFANGQFILFRRDEYERIGSHHGVRRAIIEDIPLAERAKAAGVRCRVASGRHLVAVRMYASLGAVVNGWARIYAGALRRGWKIALSVLWLAFGSLWPYVVAVALSIPASRRALASAVDPGAYTLVWGLCLNHLAVMLVASYRFWGMGGCRRRYLVLYPLSVLIVMGILARAWWWLIVRRSLPWGATRYAIDRQGQIRGATCQPPTAR